MATSGNGMKFLWMPGKKKHNRKGQYATTKNHHSPYKTSNLGGSQGQRKQEVWSMGGGKGQRELIKADTDDFFTASASTSETACAVVANGAAIVASTSKETPDELVILERSKSENGDDELDEDKEELKNLDKSYHNASTLVLGEKNKKSNASDDLDSIEQLGDSKSDLHGELEDIDNTDTASLHNDRVRKRRRNKKSHKRKSKDVVDSTRPEDDKLIACLYYSLVCCDCTIS